MMIQKRKSFSVDVWWVLIWWDAPIVIQSMTNTPTRDILATVQQIIELAQAWAELVRITINDDSAAQAVPEIIKILHGKNCFVPIVWDFHYNGHILLKKYPDMARLISKYRVNPWNVGKWDKKDEQYQEIIQCAIDNNKPVRIWVNGWSLDEELLLKNMEENSKKETPLSSEEVYIDTMVESWIISAQKAVEWWLPKDKIIISVKMSHLQSMIRAYEKISKLCEYPLHLGLTEAWAGMKGIVSSSAALSILLQQWIGDTIRVSLTPHPDTPRTEEVEVCKNILQSMWFRSYRPQVVSCPWCWRTSSNKFQFLAKYVENEITRKLPQWKQQYIGFENTHIAVMWCIVNGIWEAKNADIWIFIPWDFEKPQLQIYTGGKLYKTLSWDDMIETGRIFMEDIEIYLSEKFWK
jgi:(E)-4-hydroxy-3-methylbut-2-enyl-diphosphate synthase